MMHGVVTLDEVFAAAAVRAASLVPETSGYLALAVGDATSRLPFAIEDRMVMLTTEGNVGITRRGEALSPRQAAAGLRDVLTRLLAVSTGTAMPALASAGRPREESDRGVDTVIEEIEAALIPVNRAAARRALARLSRETIRAKEAGKIKPRPAASASTSTSTRAAEAPRIEAPRLETARIETPRLETARIETPRLETARVEAPRLATPRVEAPLAELPLAEPVATASANDKPARLTPPPAAPSRNELTAQLAAEATTPPPLEVIHLSVSVPVVILPTPPPIPVSFVRAERTPSPAVAEPTPTLLGMGTVEVEGPPPEVEADTEMTAAMEFVRSSSAAELVAEQPTDDRESSPEVAGDPRSEDAITHALPVEPAPAATPSPLTEPLVMAQPTEAPELAFEMVTRVPRPLAEPLTPPFSAPVEPAPRALPVALSVNHPAAGVDAPRQDPSPPTRADDLLARFGASCCDDAGMREAAACLRRMTGVDPTPPPSRVEAPSEPVSAARSRHHRSMDPLDLDTPTPPSARRRSRSLGSLAVTLAVLLLGVAGGSALMKLRPDLFGSAPAPGSGAAGSRQSLR